MQIKELGHVVLYVSDLSRSADFYRDILGFNELHRDNHTAIYGSGRTHHELLLIEIGVSRDMNAKFGPGLYHIGFKIGDNDDDLREAIKVLNQNNIIIVGTANHHVTHSVYILDPDHNELELYVDIDDIWKTNPKAIMSPATRLSL